MRTVTILFSGAEGVTIIFPVPKIVSGTCYVPREWMNPSKEFCDAGTIVKRIVLPKTTDNSATPSTKFPVWLDMAL